MNVKIEVIMLTYNRFPVFIRSIASLLKSLPINAEVTICAQGCTDDTNAWLQPAVCRNPRVHAHIEPENIGLARYKELIDKSTADIIVTCDDDVWDFSPGWGEVFEQVLFGDYNIGYVCAIPVNGKAGGLPIDFLLNPIQLEEDLTFYNCPCGGWFTATTREILNKAGGFPAADRSKFDLEDAIFGSILEANGIKVGAIEQISVYHACSIEDKVKFGLADQMIENAMELHKAGWITDESLNNTVAKIRRLSP